jgi:hypothetical protein
MARDEGAVILNAVIEQLRGECPVLQGRIAGAADFAQGLKNYNANMSLPAAYVIPLVQESDGNEVMVGLIQYVRKTIGVVVEFDATADRRGQVPAMNYDAIEAGLFKALLMWPPAQCRSPNQQGFAFSGGHFLDLDRARVFYQWEFSLTYQLTNDDAWVPPSEDINAIELDVHKAPVSEGRGPAMHMVLNTQPQTIWDDPNGPTIWDNGRTDWPS